MTPRTNSDSPRRAFVLSDEAVSAVWASRMGGFVAFRNTLDDGIRAYLSTGWRQTPLGELFDSVLSVKLADMQLHDETGDPCDEGYMAAVTELRDWLRYGDECDDE